MLGLNNSKSDAVVAFVKYNQGNRHETNSHINQCIITEYDKMYEEKITEYYMSIKEQDVASKLKPEAWAR